MTPTDSTEEPFFWSPREYDRPRFYAPTKISKFALSTFEQATGLAVREIVVVDESGEFLELFS
jgi:hypothetical protein